MQIIKYIIVFLFGVLITRVAFSQNDIIDSLKRELRNVEKSREDDSLFVRYEIIHELVSIGLFDEAQEEIKILDSLSKKYNYKVGEVLSLYAESTIDVVNLRSDEALEKFLKIEQMALNGTDLPEDKINTVLSSVYSGIGNQYENKEDYNLALEYYIKALKKAKEGNDENKLGVIYTNLSNVYMSTGDSEKAIEYQEQAIELKKKVNNPYSLGLSYFNLATIYDKKKEYGKAIELLQKSKDYAEKANDAIGVALCYHSMGLCYVSLSEGKGTLTGVNDKEIPLMKSKELLQKAYEFEKKAIAILEGLEDIQYLPHSYNAMGTVLGNQGHYRDAVEYYLKGYELSKANNLSASKEASEGLYFVYKLDKNYKKSLEWYEKYTKLKDSISELTNEKELGRKQAELDFIKEQEIAELKHEKERLVLEGKKKQQEYITFGITLLLLLIGVFLFIVYKRWKLTQIQKETIEEQKHYIEKEKQQTEDSINYAKSIQKAAFPSLFEVKRLFPDSFVFFQPKDIVSGDFYWVAEQNNQKFIALADCTGHGVPGAFMTLISLNILNQIIAEGITEPRDILEQLHVRLRKRLNKEGKAGAKHGLDIAICRVIDNKLTYAGVHIPLYHVRNGSLEELKGQKFQLGSNQTTLFQQYDVLLQKDDLFYISTDGFPDQKGGEKGKKYYYPRFRKLILKISTLPLDKQREELGEEINKWKSEREQLDDISVIGFRL